VVVAGEIDICTAQYLHGSLCRAAETAVGEPGAVVTVDMSDVTFIDACGLRVLAVADAYACVRGVRMMFTSVPASISRLLRITGLSPPGLDDQPPGPRRSPSLGD
jgi:anti-anti-sigma factor